MIMMMMMMTMTMMMTMMMVTMMMMILQININYSWHDLLSTSVKCTRNILFAHRAQLNCQIPHAKFEESFITHFFPQKIR